MKQHLSPEQTAKLIELGLLPKHIKEVSDTGKLFLECCGFSIGELLSFLPTTITARIWWGEDKGQEGVWGLRIDTGATDYGWDVSYERDSSAYLYREGCSELIDALYDMIVKLKEEGVI